MARGDIVEWLPTQDFVVAHKGARTTDHVEAEMCDTPKDIFLPPGKEKKETDEK